MAVHASMGSSSCSPPCPCIWGYRRAPQPPPGEGRGDPGACAGHGGCISLVLPLLSKHSLRTQWQGTCLHPSSGCVLGVQRAMFLIIPTAAGPGSAPFPAPSQCLNDHGAVFCPSMPPPLCRWGAQPQDPATLPPGVCGHLAQGRSLALFTPQLWFRRAGSHDTGGQGLLDSLSPACLPPPAASRWLSPV